MNLDLESLIASLAATPGSIALRESLYLYPWIETTHVLGIMLFVGTIALIDLRILGLAFLPVPMAQMNARILPWTITAFVVMMLTGLALFYAIPVRSFHSVWLRAKILLMLVAAINVWLFNASVRRDPERWNRDEAPSVARASSLMSLVIWALVIVTGRMIAYNWFDCDRPQSAMVGTLAGCPMERGMP